MTEGTKGKPRCISPKQKSVTLQTTTNNEVLAYYRSGDPLIPNLPHVKRTIPHPLRLTLLVPGYHPNTTCRPTLNALPCTTMTKKTTRTIVKQNLPIRIPSPLAQTQNRYGTQHFPGANRPRAPNRKPIPYDIPLKVNLNRNTNRHPLHPASLPITSTRHPPTLRIWLT